MNRSVRYSISGCGSQNNAVIGPVFFTANSNTSWSPSIRTGLAVAVSVVRRTGRQSSGRPPEKSTCGKVAGGDFAGA